MERMIDEDDDRSIESLRESEEFHRNLIELSSNAIIVHAQGKILFINQNGLSLIGATKFEDIADRSVISFVHPDYREIVIQRIKATQVNHKKIEPYKEKFLKLDGSVLDVEVVGAPISYQGEAASLLIIRDITDELQAEEKLRESEIKYRTIFEDTRDAIYITSKDGKLIDVNQSMMDLFGYGKDMLKINVLKTYASPEDRKKFQKEIDIYGFVNNYPIKLRHKNGNFIECEITATVKKNIDNEIIGYQGIIRDMTEELKAKDNMIKTQKLESLGVLAGGIAHDFNNLLMAIMGYIDLARVEISPDSPAISLIDQAIDLTKNAGNLTRQLLAYSGKGRFILESQDINEFLLSMKRLLHIATSLTAKIEYDLQDNLPLVKIDTSQFTHLISNIFVNAYESIRDNEGIITFSTGIKQIDQKYIDQNSQFEHLEVGDYIIITISDTGLGMDKDIINKIFDPFFSTKFTGRGLGLAAALGIIRSHKGAINVSSEPGVGSIFQILIPPVKE